MDRQRLLDLLHSVARGVTPPEAAADHLRDLPFEQLGDLLVDHHRPLRVGIPEVVLGEWKTATQIAAALRALAVRGQGALATRVDAVKAAAVLAEVPGARWHEVARLVEVAAPTAALTGVGGRVTVVCAGTSDLPVAEEAALTAEFLGAEVRRIHDVGVAGLHRLLARLDDLRWGDAVVAVAGMEGALPSVLAGLLDRSLIAVPTSVGYGVSLGGLAALAAMLSSCAAGVTVVNIDNGFGAAVAACRVARLGAAVRAASGVAGGSR